MSDITFFQPVVYGEQNLSCFQNLCELSDRLLSPFNTQMFKVTHIKELQDKTTEFGSLVDNPQGILSTCIKILLCCTLILPLIALTLKIIHRCTHDFRIQSSTPLSPPSSTPPPPPSPIHAEDHEEDQVLPPPAPAKKIETVTQTLLSASGSSANSPPPKFGAPTPLMQITVTPPPSPATASASSLAVPPAIAQKLAEFQDTDKNVITIIAKGKDFTVTLTTPSGETSTLASPPLDGFPISDIGMSSIARHLALMIQQDTVSQESIQSVFSHTAFQSMRLQPHFMVEHLLKMANYSKVRMETLEVILKNINYPIGFSNTLYTLAKKAVATPTDKEKIRKIILFLNGQREMHHSPHVKVIVKIMKKEPLTDIITPAFSSQIEKFKQELSQIALCFDYPHLKQLKDLLDKVIS